MRSIESTATDLAAFSDGQFQVDGNGDGEIEAVEVDVVRNFGGPGDRAIVGDWNGDGVDDLGVKRGDKWFRDGNGNGKWDGVAGGDLFSIFGGPSDAPLIGDWNGDGVDEIGIRRGDKYFRDGNGNGKWDGVAGGDLLRQFGSKDDRLFVGDFGSPQDKILIGDWDDDGDDDFGTIRENKVFRDGNDNFRWDGVAGGDLLTVFGKPADQIIVGNFTEPSQRYMEKDALLAVNSVEPMT